MSNQRNYTNEQLTGYLDGELDDALRADIRAALAGNPQLQQRLEQLSLSKPAIKSAFDELLLGAPAAPDFIDNIQPPRNRHTMLVLRWVAATAVICLLIGGLAGAYIAANRGNTWQNFAATYHALYVNSTLSHVKQTQSAAAAELKRVTAAFGKTIDLAALLNVPRLDYKRSQILGFNGRPLLQIAFLSRLGVPIVLCIFRGASNEAKPLQREILRGMRAVTWSKGNFEFLLIGGNDAALLDQAASILAGRL